jgi:hypothetical protein
MELVTTNCFPTKSCFEANTYAVQLRSYTWPFGVLAKGLDPVESEFVLSSPLQAGSGIKTYQGDHFFLRG